LAFIAVNADVFFKCMITLTYRAPVEAGESDADRNRRVVLRSQADRHRFLRCVAKEVGAYLWVREFQKRGVVHYHLLCENEVTQERATEVWCRASDQLHDEAVLRHGVRVDAIQSQGGSRNYLGRYVGKELQKDLPENLNGAGRWWGRSRSLKLALVEDIVWLDLSEGLRRPAELRIVRILRGYVERAFGRRYRGGAFVDYGGKLSAKLAEMAKILADHYGSSPGLGELLANHGWEPMEGAGNASREGRTGVREAAGDDGEAEAA